MQAAKQMHDITAPKDTKSPNQHYEAGYHSLGSDAAGRLAAQHYLDNSTAIYHGEVVRMGYLPQIYELDSLAQLKSIAETTARILDKVTRHYLNNAEYRSLFGFSPLLEELICLETGYETLIPIMRVDIFFDQNTGDFMFCEFNTDGSSAMNEDREICNAIALTPCFALARKSFALSAQELFDPWVKAFLTNYAQWLNKQGGTSEQALPTIAIVDYQQSATLNELEEFRLRFQAAGCKCLICDIPCLTYRQGELYGTDLNPDHPNHEIPLQINAVYRRAVTSEIMADIQNTLAEEPQSLAELLKAAQPNGVFALCAAATEQSVCLQGGFVTQIAHSKSVFRMLHHEQTLALFTEEEQDFIRKHVPYTAALSAGQINLRDIKNNKDQWIIKPIDGYGSAGVYAGKSLPQVEWENLINEHSDGSYVVQTYCEQFSVPNTLPLLSARKTNAAVPNQADGELIPYNVLTGLFLYNNVFSGVYTRAGTNPLIVGFLDGVTLGTLMVNYDEAQAQSLGLMIESREL